MTAPAPNPQEAKPNLFEIVVSFTYDGLLHDGMSKFDNVSVHVPEGMSAQVLADFFRHLASQFADGIATEALAS